ncbi:MAG TPA: ABC transporter substrate-binding protein [Limnochordales bacterium]|nr:ABC transporter substrate-binding protein [Limnochordales bacterium]
MNQRLRGWAVLGLLALVLGAAGIAGAQPIHIEYWHINSATFGGAAVKEAVERFQELNPDIRVTDRFQQGDYGGLLNNLQAALAAGNPPAVAQIGYNYRLFAFEQVPHVPFESFRDSDPGYDEFINSFVDGVLGLGQDADGVQRAIPLAVSVPLLYYNADLFRQAGLDPDNPPRTWEEVRQAARQIRERTGQYGIGIQITSANNWVPQSMVESNGGWLLDPEGRVAIDSPEVIEVYKFWQDLAQRDRTLPVVTDAEQEQAFVAGRLGMYIKTSAILQNFAQQANFELRTAPFPTWGDKPRRVAAGGNALFITARDPGQQRAAYEFIKFLTSKEGQTIWVKGTGYLPIVQGVEDDPRYLADFFAENPLMRAAVAQLPDAVPWAPFPGPRGFEAETTLAEAREAILNGADVEATLRETAAILRRLLGQ